jgi:hypothetical protein
VQAAADQRVLALHAARNRACEGALRHVGRNAGDPRQPAVERSVQHAQALAAQRLERELIREPRREAEHGLDGRVVRGAHADGPAHREAEKQRALRADLRNGGARILDTPVELAPRLDAVTHLAERELRKTGSEPGHEPFERGAPRALHLGRLAAVQAHHRRGRVERPRDTELRTGAQLHQCGRNR